MLFSPQIDIFTVDFFEKDMLFLRKLTFLL